MIYLSNLIPLNEYSKFRLNIPSDIKNIHKLFKKNKKKLFVVGGAVRDAILGKNPKDFDLATDAKPDEVLAIAKKGGLKTVEVGKQFGVVIVAGHEIATFRKDIGKGRRPSSVDYTDIEGDVKRRDLTINALFYDMDRGEIVDLVGGIADLKRKKIRTVGNAVERFDEDPLRKMRALRFQGALGGKLGKETEKALRQNPSLKGVSTERIRDEFVKSIKKAKSTKKYLQLADSLGFTKQILPGFQVKVPYINENDYILFLSWILRKNDVNSLRKLNGLAYPNQEIVDIQFLNSLQNFKPENIFMIKKFQEKTKLSKGQILKWGKYIGKDFKKLVRFKLSVRGSDVSGDLKGKDIGKAIQNKEKDKFLNENSDKAKLYKLYTMAMKMMPGSSAQKKVQREIEKLRKKLKMNEIAMRKKPKKFKDIYNALPSDLKKRVYNLKNYDQRRDAHPEGNVLKHTIAVTNRALKTGDIDFALAALFHDIGKDSTAKLHPKKGFWTHYGHEHVSAKLVKKYAKWIKSMGGNVLDIYWIVKQHMRMKVFDKMKWHKQEKMKKFRAFDKLKKFSKDFDKGGRR
jgi:tRNA nucleotidyltransferase/poly(A) polymerase